MDSPVTIGVPLDEASELAGVEQAFAEAPVKLEAHPFDGEVLAQVAGFISSGGVPVLIAWIKSRTERRKYMSISAGGVEVSGYTMVELEPILDMLKEQRDDS